MPVQDECQARSDEIEKLLQSADEQWRLLQMRVEEAEENFLEEKLDALNKWFLLEASDLQNFHVGTVRHSIRDRLRRIIVLPLSEKMSQRVSFTVTWEDAPEGSNESKQSNSTLMEDLLKFWEVRVKPEVNLAKLEDDKLCKKIRKTEKDETKAGNIALNGDTKKVAALKRQRPAIWEAAQALLDKFGTPMKKLSSFFSDEMSQESVSHLIGAVPSIVSRAICDHYFQRCTLDLDQLELWWKNTKATLQEKAVIWERLKEQEPRLLRNVEAGLEDLCSRRHRYHMYATFGGSEIEVLREMASTKLEESVTLLANVVSEMHKRLRMIRDSALWRIIESAQSIHKALKAEVSNVSAWSTVTTEEGALALAEAIGCPSEDSSPSGAVGMAMGEEEMSEAALTVMDRLGKLVGLSIDVKEYFQTLAPKDCAGVCKLLDALVAKTTEVNEELLCLLDDPSPASLKSWLEQWATICQVDAGEQIEVIMSAMPLKRDNEMADEARRKRRKWLALLRGVQVLLNQQAIRLWAVSPLAEVEAGSPTGTWRPASETAQADIDELVLETPPSPRAVLLAPPGGGQAYRPPERKSLTGGAGPVDQGTAGVPMGNQSVWRPETASTTCEDGPEMRSASRPPTPGKFVNGAYVSLRPNSSSMRLPPIHPPVAPTDGTSAPAS